jgi:hypothetical protein
VVGKESEPSWVASPAENDETSRYVRNSAHLPHLQEQAPGQEHAVATRDTGPEADPAVPPSADEPRVVIDLRDRTSRYERRSGALPHLTDDPEWVSPLADMPQPIREEKRRGFRRLRPRLRRS